MASRQSSGRKAVCRRRRQKLFTAPFLQYGPKNDRIRSPESGHRWGTRYLGTPRIGVTSVISVMVERQAAAGVSAASAPKYTSSGVT